MGSPEDTAERLLALALSGTTEAIVEVLDHLDEPTRFAVYKLARLELKAQDDECAARTAAILATLGRGVNLSERADRAIDAIRTLAAGGFVWPTDYQQCLHHSSRLGVAIAGLGPKDDVGRALKRKDVAAGFVRSVATVLLKRQGDWVEGTLAAWLKWAIKVQQGGSDQGIATVLWQVRSRYPVLRPQLVDHLTVAMLLDGFGTPDWWVDFDDELILAGLSRDSAPKGRGFMTSGHPLLGDVGEKLVLRASQSPKFRAALIGIVFRRINGPIAGALVRPWARLVGGLQLSRSEIEEHADPFVSAISVAGAPVVDALTATFERHLRDGQFDPEFASRVARAAMLCSAKVVQKRGERMAMTLGLSLKAPIVEAGPTQIPTGQTRHRWQPEHTPGTEDAGLSDPTDAYGHLEPKALTERLLRIASAPISSAQLAIALYRLPLEAGGDEAIWARLATAVRSDQPAGMALELAFAPLETARSALDRFVTLIAGRTLAEEHYNCSARITDDTAPASTDLRLLISALRLREPVGASLSARALETLTTDRWPYLARAPGVYRDYDRARVFRLLIGAPPIDDALVRAQFEQPPFWNTPHPCLAPYLLLGYFLRPGKTDPFLSHDFVFDAIQWCPRLAQTLFDIAAARVRRNPKEKDLATQLLQIGRSPFVDIESSIGRWTLPLTSPRPEQRRIVFDLISDGVEDRRLHPESVIGALAAVIGAGAPSIALDLQTSPLRVAWLVLAASRQMRSRPDALGAQLEALQEATSARLGPLAGSDLETVIRSEH